LLRVEVNRIRVSQSDLKTSGGAMTGGARGTASDPGTLVLLFFLY
jgi:hypothetical protein